MKSFLAAVAKGAVIVCTPMHLRGAQAVRLQAMVAPVHTCRALVFRPILKTQGRPLHILPQAWLLVTF